MIKLDRPACPNPSALRTNYKLPENKEALISASFAKCMYCESKFTETYFGDVEHIKPKSEFPNLEFVWENLGVACAKCNNAKGNKFFEDLPFINPYDEDPSHSMKPLGTFLFPLPGNDRSKVTIETINLNRPELVERRKEKLSRISDLLELIHGEHREPIRKIYEAKLEAEISSEGEHSLVGKVASEALTSF